MRNRDDCTRIPGQCLFQRLPGRQIQMIGRFVQNQTIRIAEQHAGQVKPHALPTTQNGNPLLDVIPVEQEFRQPITGGGVTQIRMLRQQLLQNRTVFIIKSDLLSQITVTHPVTEAGESLIILILSHEHPQQRGLAAAIGTDDANMIPAFDQKFSFVKQDDIAKRLAEVLGTSHFTADVPGFAERDFRPGGAGYMVQAAVAVELRLKPLCHLHPAMISTNFALRFIGLRNLLIALHLPPQTITLIHDKFPAALLLLQE